MLKARNRSKKGVHIVHQIAWAVLVHLFVMSWRLLGCPGIPDCYFCSSFRPDTLGNPHAVSPSPDDFAQLIDLRNFSFLMNNHVCNNNNELLLLILVHSGPLNFEKRFTIRSTWGKVIGDEFKLLFLLGAPESAVTQKNLEEENNLNGDLVQGNFADTYRNLTYKHVMALKWMKYFCPKAKYLLKTDDDVFVNTPNFLDYISGDIPQTKLMRCLPVIDGFAQRSTRSKWRVTWSEYNRRFYPSFCQGFSILYSSDVVLKLYEKAQTASYFWIDDVFITGFVALSTNFTPSNFGKRMLNHTDLAKVLKSKKEFSYLLGPWNLKGEEIRALWDLSKSGQGEHWQARPDRLSPDSHPMTGIGL